MSREESDERAAWCSICQQWRECGMAELVIGGQFTPIGICCDCWRDMPIGTKGTIVASYPLALRLGEAARVIDAAVRLAALNADGR